MNTQPAQISATFSYFSPDGGTQTLNIRERQKLLAKANFLPILKKYRDQLSPGLVDENGKIHYGDRPPQSAGTKEVDVKSAGSGQSSQSAAGADSPAARRQKQRRLLQVMEQERKERAAAREKKAEELREKKALEKKCAVAKQTLEQYRSANYLFEKDAAGEHKVLSAEKRAKAEKDLAESIAKHCR